MQNFKQLQLKHVSNRNRQKFQQGGSIVDYLKSQGLASDMNTRKAMARRYGVSDYKGTADQNLRLMELIKMNQELSPTTTMQGVPVTREVGNGRVETYTPDITVKNPGYIDMSKYKKPVVQPLTFKQAFRDARKAGLTEFEWNGGRYNTELAQPAVETKKIEVKQQYTEPRQQRVPDPITRTVISEVDPKLRSNTLEYGKAQAEAAMERMHQEALLGEWNAASLDEKKVLASQGRVPKGVVWNVSTPVARYTGGQAYGWRGIR